MNLMQIVAQTMPAAATSKPAPGTVEPPAWITWAPFVGLAAIMLLFMSRGRHPIMMNKLRFDGMWSNRPREVANVANFMSRELERPLNWQVVDITRTPADWADSPILFMASSKAPTFNEVDRAPRVVDGPNGGQVWLCGACAKPRGITEEQAGKGATIVGAAKVVEEVISGAKTVAFA